MKKQTHKTDAPYYPFTVSTLARALDAKTSKGLKYGYLTAILYLSPANESGLMHASGAPVNTCPFSTAGCRASCLYTAGRAEIFPAVNRARRARTAHLVEDRKGFLFHCRKSISKLIRKATKAGLIPVVRINGTSDLPQVALTLAADFPDVQFYDYTKIPNPWTRTRDNYHVTFSLSESNAADAQDALAHGISVAVAFAVKRGHALPTSYMGRPVIDGDLSDLRFKDAPGVIVGLRAKGRARKDASGFVKLASIAPVPLSAPVYAPLAMVASVGGAQ